MRMGGRKAKGGRLKRGKTRGLDTTNRVSGVASKLPLNVIILLILPRRNNLTGYAVEGYKKYASPSHMAEQSNFV